MIRLMVKRFALFATRLFGLWSCYSQVTHILCENNCMILIVGDYHDDDCQSLG